MLFTSKYFCRTDNTLHYQVLKNPNFLAIASLDFIAISYGKEQSTVQTSKKITWKLNYIFM